MKNKKQGDSNFWVLQNYTITVALYNQHFIRLLCHVGFIFSIKEQSSLWRIMQSCIHIWL